MLAQTSIERTSDSAPDKTPGANQRDLGAEIFQTTSLADWKSSGLTDLNSIAQEIPGLSLIEVTDGADTLVLSPNSESFLPGPSGDVSRMNATADACSPEYEQKTIMVNGIETVVRSITPYGDWLRDLAEDALNEPMPDIALDMEKDQHQIVDAAGPVAKALAENLEAMAKGQLDPIEMRKNFKALQDLFLTRMEPDKLKEVCDAINQELANAGKEWMRISISETSGEIWLGALSGHSGKFTPIYEIRNKTGCPPMPEQ